MTFVRHCICFVHVILSAGLGCISIASKYAAALDNGVALTPPMGFNSYMAGSALQDEAGLRKVAEFLIESGMRDLGYKYINTDEGWEEPTRNSEGNLIWNSTLYPSGLPNFIDYLHNHSFYFGIYGAASAVTCGVNPGQLYHEHRDAAQFAEWGVDFLKSDNCASYALDSSVRYRAMRDALNATGRPMVLSIEPFSMDPDPTQSSDVANMWRTGVDIEGTWDAILDRADMADKWAPLAGPRYGWNDPDMINVHSGLTLGQNRVYFGLWAIMKAPLLISTDLLNLDKHIFDIISNKEIIRINQDALGIPARKVQIDGEPISWKVGVEDCSFPNLTLRYSRRVATDVHGIPRAGPGRIDTRQWEVRDTGTQTGNRTNYQIRNEATDRCLTQLHGITVVLLPCSGAISQQWMFDKGLTTVTSITNTEVNKALAIKRSVLYSQVHGKDKYAVSDLAFGGGSMILVEPVDQDTCTSRWCENYQPEQMWYYSPMEGLLRHSLYTSSMNHIDDRPPGEQDGYVLTGKVPTFRHNCLAHVLSVENNGTESGSFEAWAGPLSGGEVVVALVNRLNTSQNVSISLDSVAGPHQSYLVHDSWKGSDLFVVHPGESIAASVWGHDIAILRLIPVTRSTLMQVED